MAEVQPPPARAVPASGNSEPLFIVVLHAPCCRRYRRVLRELAYRAAPVPTFGCGSSKSAVARPAPSFFPRDGGLLSRLDTWRRAASYADRILRGAKPGDLPVQLPTKYEMAVNRKTATALGLAIPPSIMLRADEVIE